MLIYDSIIVGGGPAGASAAYAMARSGLKVLLLEKAMMPRYKCCAGGIPRKVAQILDFDFSSCCDSPIRGIVFSWISDHRNSIKEDNILGWVVKREIFDHLLLEQARSAGAEVVEGCRFLDLKEEENFVRVTTTGNDYRGSTLIGADGALSTVARKLRLKLHSQPGFALETRLKVPDSILDRKRETIYFDMGAIPGGYAWIFPLHDQLNVGVASRRPGFLGLKQCLLDYLRREGLENYNVDSAIRGAPMAFRLLPFRLVKGHCCLTGDAAGLIDRMSGEGIYTAILSGQLAAEAVENFLAGRAQLDSYQTMIRKNLGMNIFLANLASRATDLFPRLIFDRVCANPTRTRKAMALVQGELDYRDVLFRRKYASDGSVGSD